METFINALKYVELFMLLLCLFVVIKLAQFTIKSNITKKKYNKECEEQKESLANLTPNPYWRQYHANILRDVFLNMDEAGLAHYRKIKPRLTVVGNFVDLRACPAYLTPQGLEEGVSMACYGLSIGEPVGEIANVFKITEKQARELRFDSIGINDKIVIAGDLCLGNSSIIPLVFDNCNIVKIF